MWAASMNIIYTNDVIQKKGMIFSNQCMLCRLVEEDNSLLLIKYEVAQQIWLTILTLKNYARCGTNDNAMIIRQC